MDSYATDLASTLPLLHNHPLYFTAAYTLTAGRHNYTMSTLTPKYTVIVHLINIIIILAVHIKSYQSLLWSLSSSPESSSSVSVPDSGFGLKLVRFNRF